MYNVPTIVCGSVAGCGLDEKRGATPATRDAIFLMRVIHTSSVGMGNVRSLGSQMWSVYNCQNYVTPGLRCPRL